MLRPGAALGVIWNIEDCGCRRRALASPLPLKLAPLPGSPADHCPDNKPAGWPATTAWEQKLNDLIYSLPRDSSPRFRDCKWQDVFTNQLERTPASGGGPTTEGVPRFSLPLGEDRVPWTVWLAPETLWGRFATLSQVAILEGEAKQLVRHKFDEALGGEDVDRNERGEVGLHGVTYFAWTDRL